MRGGGVVTRPRTRRVRVIVQSRAQCSAVAAEELTVPGESPRTRLRRRSATHIRGWWAGNARPRANPRTLQPFRRRGAHATCGRRPLAPPTVRPLRSVPSRHLARRHSAGPSLVPSDVPFNEARAGTPQRRPLPVVDLGVPSHLGQVDDILRHRDRVLPRRTRRRVEPAGPSRQEPSRVHAEEVGKYRLCWRHETSDTSAYVTVGTLRLKGPLPVYERGWLECTLGEMCAGTYYGHGLAPSNEMVPPP